MADKKDLDTANRAAENAAAPPQGGQDQAPAQPQAPVAQPQAPAVDIAAVVASALIAAQNLRLQPVTATPGLDTAPREGGLYYERGQVLDAEGRVIEQASAAHRQAARNAFLPPGRRQIVAPLDEGEAEEPDIPVDRLPRRGQEPQD